MKNSKRNEARKYWKMIKRKRIYPTYRNIFVDDYFHDCGYKLKDFLEQKTQKT